MTVAKMNGCRITGIWPFEHGGDVMLSSEEQLRIRAIAAEFARREIVPFAVEWDRQHAIPPITIERMFAAGLMGVSLEETNETMVVVDELNQRLGITVLFTEHDMSVVFNHARRITVLHRGKIIAQGLPEEIRNDKYTQEIYFGETA